MTKCNERLTEEQKELVTKNHDLIYAYAHKSNISIDEYYDVLAIGLCKAARAFDETKGKFSTLAYTCMTNELYKHWETLKKSSAIPDECVVSYDAQDVRDDEDNRQNFLNIFSDSQSYKDIEHAIMFNGFINKLTAKEKVVFGYLVKGFTHTEIADILNCSTYSLGIKDIRDKFVRYMSN